MKRLLLLAPALLLVLLAVLIVRTVPRSMSEPALAASPDIAIDTNAVARRLAEAIRIPTITDGRPMPERAAPFLQLHAWLEQAYPRVHATLRRELPGDYSLLFTWPGSDPSAEPILLMGHLDVVPVAEDARAAWTHAPFEGIIAEGQVWGRGALDDKQHVIALLDAVEYLLRAGVGPKRTVYLFFGHDEEAGGNEGAQRAAALLQQRHGRLWYVLDEGGIIGENIVPGVRRPVALVKIAEKGYLTIELSVPGSGGHSSAPPRPTPVGILAGAIASLEERPFATRLDGATRALLTTTAPEQRFAMRVVLANLWLFGPLVKRQLAAQPGTDATIRTTIAPTMLQASPKDNVLPTVARAVINFRILPGETSAAVLAHVRAAIDDERVQMRSLTVSEAPPAADPGSEAFALLSRSIREIAPEALVAPFLLSAATDSRHFSALTGNIFGFSIARGGSDILTLAHGTNERIAVADLVNAIRFYVRLLENTAF